MRMHGHAEHDPADYVPKEMYEEWAKKDPVELFEKRAARGRCDRRRHRGTGTEGRAAGSHRRAQAGARRSDAGSEHGRGGRICRLIRARPPIWRRWGWRWITRWSVTPTPSSSARTSASTAAPSRSPRASWTSTARAGWSTPRSPRPGFTGLAAGAALVGLRPIVEYQFADFISCAFDPIINVLARHHYRTGDSMPVTMRAPFGGRLRAGPCHSQSVESYFAHVPGHQDRHAGHARRTPRAC